MISPYIRASYGLGLAEYADFVSDDARMECEVLLEFGAQFGDEAVEAARYIGRFRGLKDSITRRRNALFTKYNDRLRPLLRDLSRKTADAVVKAAHPHEDQSDILKALKAGLSEDEWQALLQDAWRDANAEGNVDAMAFLAAARNEPNISFDHQFPQAVDALRNISLNDANLWIDRQLNGVAYFVGNDLADAIANGASYADLLQIARDGIEGGDGADLMLDTMISTGVSAGSIDLYDSEGVGLVDILSSAEDDECAEAAADSPWTIDEADGMVPFHPNCRCAVAPHIE